MTTSLAEQLRKLALPESSQLTDKKKKKSLLFDSAEAAKLDRDTFYDIGLDGLKELIKLEPAFRIFSDSLFDLSSRFLERTVESKDVNQKLNKNIKQFLRLLSPYLLLKHSHKALEWLICRYQIHNFNIKELMGLILPYHETKIFVKILQLINLSLPYCTHWKWLQKIQKAGTHLPKSVLVNHALSDTSFLRFICDTTLKAIHENKKHNCAQKLGTLITFYSTTIVNILSRNSVTDHHLTIILPSLMKSVTSDLTDLKAAGYMIMGQFVVSNQITNFLLDKNLQLLLDEGESLRKEQTLLILLIFQTQKPPPDIPRGSISKLNWLVKELSSLAVENVQVGPLVLKIMEACLDCIVKSGDNLVDAQVLSYTVATEFMCDEMHCKSLIRLIDASYNDLKEALKKQNSQDSSLLTWMKELMEATIEKYSDVSDNGDNEFKRLKDKWKYRDELALEERELMDLMKKCQGDSKESAWLKLRPLLLNKIENDVAFETLCKVAPFYDNLVLLLCLEKILNPVLSENKKLSKLSKILKSKFGGNNIHIKEINNLVTKNKVQKFNEIIDNYFFNLQKESENAIEFEPWLATLQELKSLDKISDSNEIWSFGMKVLLVALPNSFNATYALQILSLLGTFKEKKNKFDFEILKHLVTYLGSNKKKEIKWYDLTSQDSEIWLKVRLFEYILMKKHKKDNENYLSVLNDFSKTCFFTEQEFVRFLGSICCGIPKHCSIAQEYKISSVLVIHALHVSWKQLKTKDENVLLAFKPELKTVLVYLLIALNNPSEAVRSAVLKVSVALNDLIRSNMDYSEAVIFGKLLERSKEILFDANQVNVALYFALSPSESVQATLHHSSASCLARTRSNLLQIITDAGTPLYISNYILHLLDTVNSPEIIEELVKLGHRAVLRSRESETPRLILFNFWQRVNETTCQVLEKESVWELATKCIQHEKCDSLCPAVSFLKCITKEVFEKLSDDKKFQLVKCMITTRTEVESGATASAIASVIKKVNLDCQIILPIINQMIELCSITPKSRESIKTRQPSVIETKEWKNGISLLELIHSKKKLHNSDILIEPLFNILKFCLNQEEQTAFEYTKQLVLGCLLDCCKKLSVKAKDVNENNLNVELVVHCLRASPNPQTHHHALMLLSYLSAIIPKQVMHNVMAIFTFMGTSVARLDDEHSVKIVTQVVDAVVPALVEAISSENENLQLVVAEILRVFVWAVKDIPQHRRKPLLLQLLNTLLPENSLWIFIVLLLENYVLQGVNKDENFATSNNHYLGLQLCLSIPPQIVLEAAVKIINYLMQLPVEKMNKEGREKKIQTPADKMKQSDGLFDVEAHTPKQLRHFSYVMLIFLNSLLADNNFITQVGEVSSKNKSIEEPLKETIAAIMKFTPIVKRQLDTQQTKYWKAMAHQCYEILDKFVLLVPEEMLLQIIKKLLKHSMKSLRRKALDLLNSLLQTHEKNFIAWKKYFITQLLPPVVEIIKSVGEEAEQEDLLLQQTALFTIKLLTKLFCVDNIQEFKKILITICKISKSKTIEGPLLGSVMLTIAELVTCLKVHSVSELPVFMPLMLEIFSKSANPKTFNELLLNSLTLAIHRVVDVLPNFLSPYLDKILFSVCTTAVKTQDKPDLNKKFTQIRQKLGTNVDHRVLIPAVSRSYKKLIDDEEFQATGPLFSTLAFSFSNSALVAKIVPEVSQLFLSALSFRSDCENESKEVSEENIDSVETNIIGALVPFVLKLSESSFKSLYYQIFHWAFEQPERSITFFRLSFRLAESLKGLFILFAGHFIHKAAKLLDATNLSKTESCYFGSTPRGETKAMILLENILKTLHSVFLYDSTDSSNFLNKDKFEVLLHPLVDQLENTLGGLEELEKRTVNLITPCLAQMALATDDTLWKSLNYQILVKSKSFLPQVRIGALETIVAIAVKLGDDYLMLLPETIGSLAELLEDEDERVENAMRNAIQRLEEVLGQPIRDYFQ